MELNEIKTEIIEEHCSQLPFGNENNVLCRMCDALRIETLNFIWR